MNKRAILVFLFYLQYQSFQIFAFWVVDIDGVVCWLVELVEYAYVAFALGGCSEYGEAKLVLVDCLGATEGEQYSARLDFLHGLGVEACVTLQGIVQRVAVFGKSGRVEHNKVIAVVHFAQILESIGGKRLMARGIVEVEGNIAVGYVDGAL